MEEQEKKDLELEKKKYLPAKIWVPVLVVVIAFAGILIAKAIREKLRSYDEQLGYVSSIPYPAADEEGWRYQSASTNSTIPIAIYAETKYKEPYSITWEDEYARLAITEISLGQRKLEVGVLDLDTDSIYTTNYKPGTVVNGLVFKISITTKNNEEAECIGMNLKRISEGGDILRANTRQFRFPDTNGCGAFPNTTYNSQEVLFVVPEGEKEFLFTTGTTPLSVFKVGIGEGGQIIITKE